ncbi:MAG: hypothetical protein HFJ52_04445 [Clostridia bacterium]|nr:hypothetical protein [Clostridia bacterium]
MKKEIQNLKQTYIMLDELEKIFKPQTYMELVEKISELKSEGIINEIANKKNTNGRIPSLYMKYRIIKEKDTEVEKEIKCLSPELSIEKYLNNKEIYKKQRKEIQKLDQFLKNQKEKLKTKISKNERAYQIWQYEKMLDTPTGKSIINFNNLEKKLNFYLTPEPFFDYILEQKEKMTILIIENKDTWYTMRKIAKNNKLKNLNILGKQIDGIIYGEGNKITKLNALKDYEEEMLKSNVRFLYWGDLDFSGINIYERVKESNINSNIKLFTEIYTKMIELSKNKELMIIPKEQNKNINLNRFIINFSQINTQEKIKEILKENKYIPQEILNYEEIEKLLKEI